MHVLVELTKTQSIAERPVSDATEDDVNGIFYHYVDFVLDAHGASLQQTEACSI